MKTHLGHYEIVSELGRGGMGVVYKGFEPSLNRHVAIKELSPSLAHDQNLVERFLREARSMAALNDPHIIQIYFIGQDDATNQPFFVMEFVEGESLSQLLKRESKLSVENALKIVHQTAQGLATAHDKGVVHRDIKPGNLMLTPRGQVKIADFGIALATADFSKKLTSTGEFVGTPGYLSPEVCLGKQVDQRSDIFSLGIVLYEMLSGDTPFHDESPLGLMLEVVKSEIPDIRSLNSDADQDTAAILARMVAKEPGDRFQSCHELATALEAHPLVARGGTVKLPVAKPAASDATIVGAPTPASQPQRIPTPPPRVSSTASQAAAAPPPAPAAADDYATRPSAPNAARPSALERSRRNPTPVLPLAIAAVLVLVLVGGAFAFRAPLLAFAGGWADGFTGESREAGVAAGKASNPLGTSVAAEPAADGAGATPLGAGDGAAAGAQGVASAGAAGADASGDTAAATPAGERLAGGEIGNGGSAPDGDAADTRTASKATDGAATDARMAGDGEDAAAQAAVDTRVAAVDTDTRAPRASGRDTARPAGGRQLAAATEPRRVAPPRNPRIAVVALGDNAITSPAEQRVESALMRAGFDLVDESLIGYLGEDPASVLAGLREEADVLVLIRAEAIGSQQLTYYGQSSTLYSAYLGMRAYHIADKRALGPGIRTKVDFTTLNAQEKAMEVVEPGIDTLVGELGPYRPRGRG